MFKVLIKTFPFIDEFAIKEIKEFSEQKPKKISSGFYEISFDTKEELFDFTHEAVFYNRTFKRIYLKIDEFVEIENIGKLDLSFIEKQLRYRVTCEKKFKFDVEKSQKKVGSLIKDACSYLDVDLKNFDLDFRLFNIAKKCYLGMDLAGFELSKRDYKINVNSLTLNSLVYNYVFYLLGLDKLEKYSIIDPLANYGEITIEASYFNPRNALNLRKRYDLPVMKLFNLKFEMPKEIANKNKYIAVVNGNRAFKFIKENLNYTNQKIKVSDYELDWLDVKFKGEDLDYVITQLPTSNDNGEFDKIQKEFFYQAEFIAKKMICVISKKEIDKKYLKEFKLKLKMEKVIEVVDQKYFIYVIK